MIKLIATDVDGTIVKDGSANVNAELFDTIKKLRDKGIIFVVASGRQYPSIRNMFSSISEDLIFVAENGAHIVCRETEMSVTEMDRDKTIELIKDFRLFSDCHMLISTPQGSYTESKNSEFINWMVHGYHNKITVVDDILSEDVKIIKVSLCHMNGIRGIAERLLLPKWDKQFKVCMAGEQWLDFMDESVDKGQAIKTIQDFFRIDAEETMVFGDNSNDIGMFKRAKYNYAVENASQDAIESADFIAKSYKENGVINILKTLL